jgi:hypothetical protein
MSARGYETRLAPKAGSSHSVARLPSGAFMRRLASFSVFALAASLAISCTDATVAPTSTLRPRPASASLTSARPRSYPNSQKYRDAGHHPATGRSGSAVVSVRALLGRSGTADVDVTTGTFDEGPTPGRLASVQVKGYTPSGALFLTRNHTALEGGSTGSFPYAGLPRGTHLQVQTIVRGIDDARTDVVTMSTAVHMRPDLVAVRLEGPAETPIGGPVNFKAFIRESNGEVGARASCVLYVNGVAVDRANGIWVDAGDQVACAMTHTFSATGTHSLELRVDNVRPGDYDDSNNRATASIRVVAPSEFTAYSVQAWSGVDNYWSNSVTTVNRPGGTVEIWDQTNTQEGPYQFASVNGIIPRLLDFPIRFQGEMVTNGVTINSVDRTHETGAWVDYLEAYCADFYSLGGGASTYVCVHIGSYLAGYTRVQYDWWGGDVRYHSDTYVRIWDATGGLLDSWTTSFSGTQVSPMFAFGPDFTGRLSVRGAGDAGPTTAIGTVSFAPYLISFETDPSCFTIQDATTCVRSRFDNEGTTGFVDYGSWPQFTP